MNAKVIFAVLLVGLLCTSTFVEGRSKLHRALKRVGHAVEKVGKKALEDGTVTKVILAGAIGRKKRSAIEEDDIFSKEAERPSWRQPIPYTR